MTDGSASSIWLRPARSGRGPAPEHSRTDIARLAIGLADANGLGAVTMRAVAAALGSGPASLYRYVDTRDELLELMIDEVNGEFTLDETGSGDWLAEMLNLAHQARSIYLRHPWLLDALASRSPLGPNAVRYLEHALARLHPVRLTGGTKLVAIAMFNSVIRALVCAEVDQQQAGRSLSAWQAAQAAYLGTVVQDGRHPQLAAALSSSTGVPSSPRPSAAQPQEPLFDRVLRRVLTGLLDEDAG